MMACRACSFVRVRTARLPSHALLALQTSRAMSAALPQQHKKLNWKICGIPALQGSLAAVKDADVTIFAVASENFDQIPVPNFPKAALPQGPGVGPVVFHEGKFYAVANFTSKDSSPNFQPNLPSQPIQKLVVECLNAVKGIQNVRHLAVVLQNSNHTLTPSAFVQHTTSSFYHSLYQDNRLKAQPKPDDPTCKDKVSIDTLSLVLTDAPSPADCTTILRQVEAVQSGTNLTRDLVNTPANLMQPQQLADAAKVVADSCKERITLKILGREECKQHGMGAFLAVAAGSVTEPKFIHLIYDGSQKGQPDVPSVAILGKGLTFDSGGYNLKVGGSMIETMKFDMAGAAAVLGVARALAQQQPEGIKVHLIMPCCENMISGGAMRPGDVIVASNGKTIEVNNTDAEGRLALCDALVYTEKHTDAKTIIDIATLTGAVVVALGENITGLYSRCDELAKGLESAARESGELMWRMPLYTPYKEVLNSKIADITNTGNSRWGGSITAAVFLSEFVNTPKWAHLDIAGTAWNSKTQMGTGHAVATLTRFLSSQIAQKQ